MSASFLPHPNSGALPQYVFPRSCHLSSSVRRDHLPKEGVTFCFSFPKDMTLLWTIVLVVGAILEERIISLFPQQIAQVRAFKDSLITVIRTTFPTVLQCFVLSAVWSVIAFCSLSWPELLIILPHLAPRHQMVSGCKHLPDASPSLIENT